jgi:hypothetical protein
MPRIPADPLDVVAALEMNVTSLPHAALMRAIELIGAQVASALHQELATR